MIKSLNGKIIKKGEGYIVLDVAGFGVCINTIKIDLENEIGMYDFFHTKFIMTDNKVSIYGFRDEERLNIFERLIKIKGVGPSTCLNILNTIENVEDLTKDKIIRVKGIGNKLADVIVGSIGFDNSRVETIKKFTKLGFNKDDVLKVINNTDIDESNSEYNRIILERLCEVKGNDIL